MAGLSKITVNVNRAGLGRRPINKDKVSGIVFYNDSPPTGWSSDNIQLVYTLEEAEALGLLEAATGNEDEWYHVREYFRANPDGELYIGYFGVPVGAYDYAEISTMRTFSGGEIRQIAIWAPASTFAASHVTTLQTAVDTVDATLDRLVAILGEDMSGVTWGSADDLRALDAEKCAVVACQDAGAKGAALATSKGYSMQAIGTCLGMISKSPVAESIGWPREYNISDGTELETVAMADGTAIDDSTIGDAVLGALKDKGYTIIRKYTPKLSGSYFERMPTAIPATDDLAWLEYNRVLDKAVRLAATALTPELNRTLKLNSDGTLEESTTVYFEDLVQSQLEQMQADNEISDGVAEIDPTQNVLSTSTLVITIKVVPLGIAEFITIKIGFTTSI